MSSRSSKKPKKLPKAPCAIDGMPIGTCVQLEDRPSRRFSLAQWWIVAARIGSLGGDGTAASYWIYMIDGDPTKPGWTQQNFMWSVKPSAIVTALCVPYREGQRGTTVDPLA